VRNEMDNGQDREVGKLEDLFKATPGVTFKTLRQVYSLIRWTGSKGSSFFQSRKANRVDAAKRELVGELLAKDKDGKIEELLRKKTEWQKYLTPEPKGTFSKILDVILRRKPKQQAVSHPRMSTKADLKTKQSFLNELLTKDKDSALLNVIKKDPQLTNYLENQKKMKTTPVKAADTSLNVAESQPLAKEGKKLSRLSDLSQRARKQSALLNSDLQQNDKARDRRHSISGSTLTKPGIKPPVRRHSVPNVSLGGR
jgi:hypothetical protein